MIQGFLCALWRLTGALGVVVLWTSTIMAIRRTGLGLVDPRPLSYLGVDPRANLIFNGGLLISSLMFVSFALYVRQTFKPGNKFMLYYLAGQAGQVIAAIAPYGDDSPYRRIHTVAAFVLAFSLPLLMRQFALSAAREARRRAYQRLAEFEYLLFVVGIGIFVFTTGIAPIGEVLPAIGFHIWILVVAYRAGRPQRPAAGSS